MSTFRRLTCSHRVPVVEEGIIPEVVLGASGEVILGASSEVMAGEDTVAAVTAVAEEAVATVAEEAAMVVEGEAVETSQRCCFSLLPLTHNLLRSWKVRTLNQLHHQSAAVSTIHVLVGILKPYSVS